MINVVRAIFSGDTTRKIEIYSRADGTFGFSHLKWASPENTWIPIGPQTASVCSTAHAAAMEGLSRGNWSRDGGPGSPEIHSAQDAKSLVDRFLHDPDVVVEDRATVEKAWGWVFFYQARSGLDPLAGNAPLLVNRNTGEIVVTGTAEPVEWYIARYEEELSGAA